MIFRPYLTADIIALVTLGISLFLALKLKVLMGKGKDTAPVKLIILVVAVNSLMGLLLVLGGYQKYTGEYLNYVRLTDIALMISGIILAAGLFKIYKDYSKLIKKHEPSL